MMMNSGRLMVGMILIIVPGARAMRCVANVRANDALITVYVSTVLCAQNAICRAAYWHKKIFSTFLFLAITPLLLCDADKSVIPERQAIFQSCDAAATRSHYFHDMIARRSRF